MIHGKWDGWVAVVSARFELLLSLVSLPPQTFLSSLMGGSYCFTSQTFRQSSIPTLFLSD